MIKRLAIATLVEDFSLYPRNKVDESHIGDLVRALKGGHELPPLVVDAASLRIVDGFHRRRALLKHGGPEVKAEVDLRKYKTEADLFLEAVALNSHHGRKLDRHDQTRIVTRLRELNVDDLTIATSLHVPAQEIQILAIRVIFDESGVSHPSKRGLEHMRGQRMTASQISAIDSVRSAEAGRLCMELSRLLDEGLVNLQDEQIVSRLRQLSVSLETVLRSLAA